MLKNTRALKDRGDILGKEQKEKYDSWSDKNIAS